MRSGNEGVSDTVISHLIRHNLEGTVWCYRFGHRRLQTRGGIPQCLNPLSSSPTRSPPFPPALSTELLISVYHIFSVGDVQYFFSSRMQLGRCADATAAPLVVFRAADLASFAQRFTGGAIRRVSSMPGDGIPALGTSLELPFESSLVVDCYTTDVQRSWSKWFVL